MSVTPYAGTPEAAAPGRAGRPALGRGTGKLMAAEAATFAVASATHFGTGFIDAAIPELIIAVVLGLGSAAVLSGRAYAGGLAIGTTVFATLGTIVGITAIATGRQDVPDLTYHAAILAALAATLVIIWRTLSGRAAQRAG